MKLSDITGQNSDPRTFEADETLVDSNTYLGVEIEVEGCPREWVEKSPVSSLWAITTDGSLRVTEAGVGLEFRFAFPSRGKDAVSAITEFCELATKKKLKISSRTGIHVHMDIRDFEWDQLLKLCALYAIFERSLFNWVGDDRDKNIFCLPWYAASSPIEIISSIGERPSSARAVKGALHNAQKYSALNLTSVLEHSTVEFRHMLTTFDKDRLLLWVNLLLSLKKYAFSFTGTIQDLCDSISRLGPADFAQDVFGDNSRYIMNASYVGDMFEGVRLAQELMSDWRRIMVYNFSNQDIIAPSDDDLTARFLKNL